MYVPRHFAFTDHAGMHRFMQAYPFAMLVTTIDGAPYATHLPLLLDPSEGEFGTLRGHVAKPNPHWRVFAEDSDSPGSESLVIFHGPHSYISPSWHKNTPMVPTWNYVAVHAYGTPEIITSEDELAADMYRLAAHYESPEQIETLMPTDYRRKLLAGIVGFRLAITRLEGARKLSQNRSTEDRAGIITALETSIQPDAPPYLVYLRDNGLLEK